jgi:hypothetical protein
VHQEETRAQALLPALTTTARGISRALGAPSAMRRSGAESPVVR